MDKPTRNGSLAPAILGVAGLLAFIGSSSAWIRVSFIQIRGLDYWFGFITAISASVIIAAGIINFKKSLVSPKWHKNWVIYSLLSSIVSITTLIAVANRVDQIGEEITKKAELPESFVGDCVSNAMHFGLIKTPQKGSNGGLISQKALKKLKQVGKHKS